MYDYFLTFGALILLAIVIVGFVKADKVKHSGKTDYGPDVGGP